MADYTYGNLDPRYVDAIRQFEGFTPQAKWDVRQNSNGYGTRARYPGEVIDKAEAERRLHEELTRAAGIVDSYASNLDPGTRAALASLTYNSGGDWMKAGLGQAVKAGDWDAARQSFGQYTKAGGQHLPGLANRRNAELGWFGAGAGATQPAQGQQQPGPVQATYPFPAPMALGAPREPVQAPSEVLAQNYGSSGTPQPSSAPQWDTGAFWAGKVAESKADGGPVPTADEILSEYSDPVKQFHHKFNEGPPVVAPWDRPNTRSPVTGTLTNYERPADWAVKSGVAEMASQGINPMVMGHGLGSAIGEVAGAAKAGDYGHIAGIAAPMAAMAVVPMGPKGMKKPPALDSLGYYSGALESARNLPQAKGTPQQMLAMMQKGGAKAGEIEATGLGKWLEENYGSTTSTAPGGASAITQSPGSVGSNGERISGSTGTADRLKQNLVTRDDIANYLENNRVGLNSKTYGTPDLRPGTRVVPRDEHAANNGFDVSQLPLKFYAIDETGAPIGGGSTYDNAANLLLANRPKWNSYSLDPSNPTYRETVLHLPDSGSAKTAARLAYERYADDVVARYGEPGQFLFEIPSGHIPREVNMRLDELNNAQRTATEHNQSFQSGHFPEPNIVGHMMTSMTKHEGKPVYTIDQIQSDWGQKLRDGGVRDEAKAQRLKQQVDEKFADLSESSRRIGHPDSNTQPSLTERRALSPERFSELNRLMAEWRDAESGAVGHPLVNTTDQWTNTTLRRALQQAIDAKADHVAIPTGDTVLSYNPGDTAGMHGFYGRGPRQQVNVGADLETSPGTQSRAAMEGIVPKNLRKMLLNIDRDHPGGTYVNQLETPSGMKGQGFTMFPITPAVREYVKKNGLPLFTAAPVAAAIPGAINDPGEGFADGGPVATPDEILAEYSDPVGQFHHKLLEKAPIVPPWDRPGTKSPVTGTLSNPPERPSDWAVKSGVAETVSPTMGAYGVGSALGEVAGAARAGEYSNALMSSVPLAAMAVMPGVKAKPREQTVRLFHGTNAEGYAGIMADGRINGPAYLGPRSVASRYGDHIVEANVPKSKLQIDMDLGTDHMFSVEDANAYRKMQDFAADIDGPWTIDDYIKNGYAVGIQDGVVIK